jgi:hypothetical protein
MALKDTREGRNLLRLFSDSEESLARLRAEMAADAMPAYCAGHWGDAYCPNAPTCTVTFTCPCGHTAADALCEDCKALSLLLIEVKAFICTVCEEGPDRHICHLMALEG